MGKKSKEARAKSEEAKKEKLVFGSGAEPKPVPKDDGLVRCVCTVPCAWRGYHDEGDRVMVERELLESDPFFKGHFKALEPLAGQATAGAGVNADGGTNNVNGGTDNENGNANGGSGNAAGNGETAAGNGETAAGGQGELGLN